MTTSLELPCLLREVAACRVCADRLPLGARPILQIGIGARLLIASQAPGRRAHQEGVPFADRTGDLLRRWLGIGETTFYDPDLVAILPVGLCYPGRGRGGDLPPRSECAPLWQQRLRGCMPNVRLTLLVGRHAQHYHLARHQGSLTAAVRAFRDYLPERFPLPHPSPRNTPWLQRHPWFESEVLPALRLEVQRVLA